MENMIFKDKFSIWEGNDMLSILKLFCGTSVLNFVLN